MLYLWCLTLLGNRLRRKCQSPRLGQIMFIMKPAGLVSERLRLSVSGHKTHTNNETIDDFFVEAQEFIGIFYLIICIRG